eukprot:TRINITY_DN8903_c0_g1_i1.p1 TRINITY_DN8903_c0_g1~~TRINITY_DN8903_c0_g1_i1.p1  ORF type:complete len:383 (+),score=41.37 TRINITY_DN8903_c0_g1_i1:329-1477(+)
MESINSNFMAAVSQAFRNLEEARFPIATFAYDDALVVLAAFVRSLPKLRLLLIHQDASIFTKFTNSLRPVVQRGASLTALEHSVVEFNILLPSRLINVVCSEQGSFSALAFSAFLSWRAMDIVVNAGWPIQIAGTSSLLSMALWFHLIGHISGSELNRTIQPILQRPELVDVRAIAPSQPLNCIQLALLTGDVHVLNAVLAVSAQMVDRDLQLLVSSGGTVNMFHTAIQSLNRNAVLPAFKLFFSRQKALGLYTSLCYEEKGDLRLTVLDALLVKHLHEPLLFLMEKGIDFESPLSRPQSRPLPSVLHAAFYELLQSDEKVEFLKAMERTFVSRRDIITKDILDIPYRQFANRDGKSLLAAIVKNQRSPINGSRRPVGEAFT